jgi:hypothetical protein
MRPRTSGSLTCLGIVRIGCAALFVLWLESSFAQAAPPPPTPVSEPGPIEFWFVEPNEGESAGGHTAIRIGERVYHVERRRDGLITDRRTSRARFEEIYRGRGNRRIEAVPLAFEATEILALRSRLETRFYERGRRLARLDALEAEAAWLDRADSLGYLGIEIPGLGFFEERIDGSCHRPDRAAEASLRRSIDERLGRRGLNVRRIEARRETVSRLSRILAGTDLERTSLADWGPGGDLRRLRQAAQSWAAFQVLAGCGALRADRLRPAPAPESLAADPSARWRATRAALELRIVRLAQTDRPDVGLAILLAVARWSALERSIATGHLHVLDPIAEGVADRDTTNELEAGFPESWLPKVRARRQNDWRRALGDFEGDRGPLEAQVTALEHTHHALIHTKQGTRHRVASGESLSASAAARYAAAEWVLPWPKLYRVSSVASVREELERYAAQLRRALRADLGYRLLSRNCVTELTRELEVLAASAAKNSRPGSRDTGFSAASASFIPIVATRSVEKSMAAGPRRVLHSAREVALQRARSETKVPWSSVREAMTLTSRTYRPNSADSRFLFFSDGPVWARPLIGIANLGYGVGATALGIFAAPFDRGEGLRRGAQGILMSVPELFFFQIRQGTYPVSPPLDLIQ